MIAYEFNIRSGGAGAKYLGIGGFKNYREDVLTISLRAVNAQTGTILHSVNSMKTIYSREVNLGLFGYVDFDVIAEVENGFAVNEPVQRGVEEAIESALIDLIVQGVLSGTWRLENPADIEHPAFSRFLSEADLQAYKIRVSSAPEMLLEEAAIEPVVSRAQADDVINGAGESVPPAEAASSSGDEPADREGIPRPIRPDPGPQTVSDGIARPRASIDEISDDRLPRVQGAVTSAGRQEEDDASEWTAVQPSDVSENDNDEVTELVEEVASPGLTSSTTEAGQDASVDAGLSDADGSLPAPGQSVANESVQDSVLIVFGYVADAEEARKFHAAMDERYDGVDVMLLKDDEVNGYRVGVGPVEDSEDVQAILADLEQLGFESVQVRPF